MPGRLDSREAKRAELTHKLKQEPSYPFWGRLAGWTLEQATTLFVRCDPAWVNEHVLKTLEELGGPLDELQVKWADIHFRIKRS